MLGRHTRIGCHIYGCSCNGQTGLASAEAVTDFAAGTCGSAVERLYRRRKVVGLGFERYDSVKVFYLKIVRLIRIYRIKLVNLRAVDKRYIVFVGRDELIGVDL